MSDWDFEPLPSAGTQSKLILKHRDSCYMVKFPKTRQNGIEILYHVSEFVACKVTASLGYAVQNVCLAEHLGRPAVLVKFFDTPLISFTGFGVSTLTREHIEYDLLAECVSDLKFNCDIEDYLWDTFMTDSFVCNLDRHPNNWGFFKNSEGLYIQAPLIDMGDSLFSLNAHNVGKMRDIDEYMRKFAKAAINYNGERQTFRQLIENCPNEKAQKARDKFVMALEKLDLSPVNIIRNVYPQLSAYCDFLEEFFIGQIKWYRRFL